MNWLFHHCAMMFFTNGNILCSEIYLDIIDNLTFSSLVLWYIFPHSFIFNLFVSSYLKSTVCLLLHFICFGNQDTVVSNLTTSAFIGYLGHLHLISLLKQLGWKLSSLYLFFTYLISCFPFLLLLSCVHLITFFLSFPFCLPC